MTLVDREHSSNDYFVRAQLQQPCALDTLVQAKVDTRNSPRFKFTQQLSWNARKRKYTQRVNSIKLRWDSERMQSLKTGN